MVELGYSRCELIEGRGQFSVRGGILDISINETTGIRIEFWGDEVDSIRNFNISSQRSINTLEKATIFPAHEYILEDKIENIIVPQANSLLFVFKDGHTVKQTWKDRSRKESWTPEMKEQARLKALERRNAE